MYWGAAPGQRTLQAQPRATALISIPATLVPRHEKKRLQGDLVRRTCKRSLFTAHPFVPVTSSRIRSQYLSLFK